MNTWSKLEVEPTAQMTNLLKTHQQIEYKKANKSTGSSRAKTQSGFKGRWGLQREKHKALEPPGMRKNSKQQQGLENGKKINRKAQESAMEQIQAVAMILAQIMTCRIIWHWRETMISIMRRIDCH